MVAFTSSAWNSCAPQRCCLAECEASGQRLRTRRLHLSFRVRVGYRFDIVPPRSGRHDGERSRHQRIRYELLAGARGLCARPTSGVPRAPAVRRSPIAQAARRRARASGYCRSAICALSASQHRSRLIINAIVSPLNTVPLSIDYCVMSAFRSYARRTGVAHVYASPRGRPDGHSLLSWPL